MAKINGCVKCLFIFFNVLFMILGCLLLYGAFSSSTQSHQLSTMGAPVLGWIWVFVLGVLGISSLGIYTACSEKLLALKIFAGFMVVSMVIMLIFGIITVVARNNQHLLISFQETSESLAVNMSSTLKENNHLKATVEKLQETTQCCGVVKAEDWGNDIPVSCGCQTNYGATCMSRPQGTTGPAYIYKQVYMGIYFAFAVTALLGLLISLLMIHQVKRHDNVGRMAIAMRGY